MPSKKLSNHHPAASNFLVRLTDRSFILTLLVLLGEWYAMMNAVKYEQMIAFGLTSMPFVLGEKGKDAVVAFAQIFVALRTGSVLPAGTEVQTASLSTTKTTVPEGAPEPEGDGLAPVTP